MSGPKLFTTDDPWLAEMQKKTQTLRQAFVLRQYDHVGFTAHTLLKEFIATRPDVSENDINGVGSDRPAPPVIDGASIDVYQNRPIDLFTFFPHKGTDTTRHLNHRAFPLSDDHPAILCVGFVVAAIQNLGYLPQSAKPTPAFLAQYRNTIAPLNQSQLQAYTTHAITVFLTETYGTWVNVTPSILLQCLQYLLPVSPLTAYLLTTHLLGAMIRENPDAPEKDRSKRAARVTAKWRSPVVLRNIRYRRQLFVYLIQAIAIGVRLRFHVIYAPGVFPFEVLEHNGTVLTSEEKFKRSFLDVYVDLTKNQADLIVNFMHDFSLTEENLQQADGERSPDYPYIPAHIQQHLTSILEAVDYKQSPFEFCSYEPFQVARVFITGTVSLHPTDIGSVTSLVFMTRPLPTKEELSSQDPHYAYAQAKLKELGRWPEPVAALDHKNDTESDSDDDNDTDVEDETTKAIVEAYKQSVAHAVERMSQDENIEDDELDSIDNAARLLMQFGIESHQSPAAAAGQEDGLTQVASPIVDSLGQDGVMEGSGDGCGSTEEPAVGGIGISTILYPIAYVAVGLLARHWWPSNLLPAIGQQALRVPGVKGVKDVAEMVSNTLYGK